MNVVLDSSAVLAVLWDEPGATRVAERLAGSRISAVNLAELVAKLVDRGAGDGDVADVIADLGVEVVAFDADQAMRCGLLRRATREIGLSLGDRACLALCQRDGAMALTADRAWSGADIGIAVEVVR